MPDYCVNTAANHAASKIVAPWPGRETNFMVAAMPVRFLYCGENLLHDGVHFV